jgi:hypothetical protein
MEGDNKKPEDMITEAEVEEIKIEEEGKQAEKAPKKKKKTDFYVELVLFLILGVLIGVAVKTEADKKITVGFNDYKMKIMKQDYDINKLQADLSKASQDAATAGNEEVVPSEGEEALPQEEEALPQDQSGQTDNGSIAPGQAATDNANPSQ